MIKNKEPAKKNSVYCINQTLALSQHFQADFQPVLELWWEGRIWGVTSFASEFCLLKSCISNSNEVPNEIPVSLNHQYRDKIQNTPKLPWFHVQILGLIK